MKRPVKSRVRFWLLAALALPAVAFPAFEAVARKKPVIEAPPPPPPPPPPGPVGLPREMIADAAAYEAFVTRAAAVSPAFASPAQVQDSLKVAAAYEPKALIRGAVAYGAIAALEAPDFVADVRAHGATPEDRRLLVNAIIADPATVFAFKGSDRAAGLARQAIGAAGMRLYDAGKAVKQASYDVQHQAWSKLDVVDRPGRLAAVKASSSAPLAPAADQASALAQIISSGGSLGLAADPDAPPYPTLLARALQLAAIAALGEAGEDAYQRLTYLTYEGTTDDCLDRAKLNLFQCLAVARPNYEDIFCAGQHAMQDTGECLARGAGVPVPLVIDTPEPLRVPPLGATRTVRRAVHRPIRRRRG
ncbi:MAG TPA: hypothetical protein VGS12_05575 [Caulobacteraceae bacterium]|nr:hypothetical protein [Caulobacteraceae bacterium]